MLGMDVALTASLEPVRVSKEGTPGAGWLAHRGQGFRKRSDALVSSSQSICLLWPGSARTMGRSHVLLAWGPSAVPCLSLYSLPPLAQPFGHVLPLAWSGGQHRGLAALVCAVGTCYQRGSGELVSPQNDLQIPGHGG